ncbi:MAG: hypothetical protein OFPII_20690 [Osedax symbiont Rs1]|nr:MAG: hypothetical protein OFPII_20690 [Osedax symbiont Rs1]
MRDRIKISVAGLLLILRILITGEFSANTENIGAVLDPLICA